MPMIDGAGRTCFMQMHMGTGPPALGAACGVREVVYIYLKTKTLDELLNSAREATPPPVSTSHE